MGQEEGWVRNRKVAAGMDFRTPEEKHYDGDGDDPKDFEKNQMEDAMNKAKVEKEKEEAEEKAAQVIIDEQKALAEAEAKNAGAKKKAALDAQANLKKKK